MKSFIITTLFALTWATGCLETVHGFSNNNNNNLQIENLLSENSRFSDLMKIKREEQQDGELLSSSSSSPQKTEKGIKFCQGCRSMISFITKFNSSEHLNENKKLFYSFCELYYPASTDFRSGPCDYFVEALFFYFQRIDPIHHCDQIGACGLNDENENIFKKNNEIFSLNYHNNNNEDNQDNNNDDEFSLKTENTICKLCEQVIKQFQEQILDPKFIDQLHRQTSAFCDYLKVVDMDNECRQMVDKYIDQAIDFIKDLKPLEYCRTIRFCSANQVKQFSLSQQQEIFRPTLVDFNNFGLETSVTLNGNNVIRNIDEINKPTIYVANSESANNNNNNNHNVLAATNQKNGPSCMICKAIVKEVSQFLKNNNTEEHIEESLNKICGLIFRKNSKNLEQCDEMVSAYTKELVKLLADESDPEVICMLIEQCTYQTMEKSLAINKEIKTTTTIIDVDDDKSISFSKFISIMDPEIPLNSLRTCVECKLFIKSLQETFEDKNSCDSIKQYLIDNLCKSIQEQDIRDSCTKMVNQYGDYFFKAVSEQLDPATVCEELKACKKRHGERLLIKLLSESESPVEQSVSLQSIEEAITGHIMPATTKQLNTYRSGVCDQCVDVVTKLDEYLSKHSVDHDVSILIDEVCNKLPDQQSKDTCAAIVKTFGQKITEIIHTMDSPKQLCQSIYLC